MSSVAKLNLWFDIKELLLFDLQFKYTQLSLIIFITERIENLVEEDFMLAK